MPALTGSISLGDLLATLVVVISLVALVFNHLRHLEARLERQIMDLRREVRDLRVLLLRLGRRGAQSDAL
ncbi:MAG: hypothetical protein QN130_12420 [Armatimonadota bacterium]|nr:hypothetical protein [Armatimonadota bacterium]